MANGSHAYQYRVDPPNAPMVAWHLLRMLRISLRILICGFDFIECFTTTFMRAHSWLNWVDEDDDEDEVGLKEKPEDTRYIKKITSK